MSNSSIWLIDRTLSGATTQGQRITGNNSNEGVLHIPKIYMAIVSPSECLMPYPGHVLGRVLPLSRDTVGVFYSPSRLGGQENETNKILWDVEIKKMDRTTLARKLNLLLINKKKTCHQIKFAVPVNHRVKIKDKQMPLSCQRAGEIVKHEGNTSCNPCTWNGS